MKNLEEAKKYIRIQQKQFNKSSNKSYADREIYSMLNLLQYIYQLNWENLIKEYNINLEDID